MHKNQRCHTNSLPPPEHRREFALIGPNAHNRNVVSGRERTHRAAFTEAELHDRFEESGRRQSSGFTLIELIVVMAVIGVLVLLAAPKFLNYTARARETHIKNDIKVLESKIDEYLIKHDKLPAEWSEAVPGDGQLYDRTGPINSLPSGGFKVVDKTFYPETNLGGNFYANNNGVIVFEDSQSPHIDKPESDRIVCSLLSINTDGPIPVSLPEVKTELSAFPGLEPILMEFAYNYDVFGIYKVNIDNAEHVYFLGMFYDTEVDYDTNEIVEIKQIVFVSAFDFYNVLVTQGSLKFDNPVFYGYMYDGVVLPDEFPYEHIAMSKEMLPKFYAEYDLELDVVNNLCYANPADLIGQVKDDEEDEEEILTNDTIFAFDSVNGAILGFNYRRSSETDIVIPSEIAGVPVKYINYNAFEYNENEEEVYSDDANTRVPVAKGGKLTSVVIPDSVIEIRPSAFRNNAISSLAVGTGVKNIESYAFSFNQITELELGNSLTYIGFGAFQNNQIKSVTIPDSVLEMKVGAFADNQITTLNIGRSLTSIENEAFNRNKIDSLIIPDNIKIIEKSAFASNQITKLELGNSLNSIGELAFLSNNIEVVTIPDSVLEIKASAFSNNQITTLELGNSLNSIGEFAFSSNNIEVVTIPDSVLEIKEGAFYSNQITKLNLNSSVVSIGRSAFENNKIDSLVVPDSVVDIGTRAFKKNQITNLKLGNSLTAVRQEAFANNQITELELGNSITVIEKYAFHRMLNETPSVVIQSLTIPNSVTEIQAEAFYNSGIKSLTLGNSVKRIGNSAFFDNKISSLIIPDSVTEIGEDAFYSNVIQYLDLGNSVEIIKESAFYYNQLTTLTIPNSVTHIGEDAFLNNNELESLILGNSVVSIGKKAFAYTDILSVTIPPSVETIGIGAFANNGVHKNCEDLTYTGPGTYENVNKVWYKK